MISRRLTWWLAIGGCVLFWLIVFALLANWLL